MSNYCTNCKWLGKESIANHTNWLCKRENSTGYILQSLCGNPAKLRRCKDECWYETKNKSEVSKLVTEHGGAMQFAVNEILKQQEKKMTTEEQIRVMQAYVDGKQVQRKLTGSSDNDYEDFNNPIWNWYHFDHRIKPEPKYKPLKPEELIELVGTVIVDKDGDQYVVGGSKFYDGGVLVFVFQSWINSSYLLKNFKYKDGTPVGKLEE